MQGSVIGEPTKEFITEQVKIRQKTYGKGLIGTTRSNADIQFMNNRNAWIKMASSVLIKGTNRVPGGSNPKADFKGGSLATKAILFNGLSSLDQNNKLQQRSGTNTGPQYIPPTTSFYNNSAYGLGGNDFGILPMPGISSVSVDSKNRGSIKTATIQITAFNRYQFDLIETLYCRLGFSMIVEWGWDKYIDNQGNYKLVKGTVTESIFFSSRNQDDIIKSISTTSAKYHGNTGGLFGKVVNFNWKYNTDGSYQITVKITGMGDVIESMKINQSPSLALKQSLQNLSAVRYNLLEKAKSSIDANKTVTKLGTILYKTLNNNPLWSRGGNGDYFNVYQALKNSSYSSVVGNTGTMKIEYNYFIRFGELLNVIQKNITPDINGSSDIKFTNFDQNTDKVICSIQPNLISFDPEVCIIKMDTGLNLNQNDISGINLPDYTKSMRDFTVIDGSTSSANAQASFDVVIKTTTRVLPDGSVPLPGTTLFTTFLEPVVTTRTEKSFSIADEDNNYTYEPVAGGARIPLVQNNVIYEQIISQNPSTNQGTTPQGSMLYGRILNIYLNYDMIFKTLSKNVDKKGNLTFFKFLQSMCDNINSAFANVIDIEPIIKDDKVITFMDTKPIAGLSNNLNKILPDVKTDTAEFEIVGFNNSIESGTFLRNISFNTKFSPKLASQLSIGATAGGVALGQDATGLSKWNSGLEDRYQQTIKDPDAVPPNVNTGNNTQPPPENIGKPYEGQNSAIRSLLLINNVSTLTNISNGDPFNGTNGMAIDTGLKLTQQVIYKDGGLKSVDGIDNIILNIDKDGKILGSNFNTPPGYIPTHQVPVIATSENGRTLRLPVAGDRNATIRGTSIAEEVGLPGITTDDTSKRVQTSFVKFSIDNSVTDAPQTIARKWLNHKPNNGSKRQFRIVVEKIVEGIAMGYGVGNAITVADSTRTNESTSYFMTPVLTHTVPSSSSTSTSTGLTAEQVRANYARTLAGKNYSAYLAQMFGGQPTVSNAQAQASNMIITPINKNKSEYMFRKGVNSFAKAGKSSYKIYLDEANRKAAANNPNNIEASNQIGLLPIEFDMEMDGIAGFDIYNKIGINQEFLPSNYANSLEFLIKGINHKIDGSGWTTNLQTLSTSNLNARPVKRNASASTGRSTNVTVSNYSVDQNILDQVTAGTAIDDGKNGQRNPVSTYTLSAAGLTELKHSEGFRKYAYDDEAPGTLANPKRIPANAVISSGGTIRSTNGKITIGYGFTRAVIPTLAWDTEITEAEAELILKGPNGNDGAIKEYTGYIIRDVGDIPVTQGEFDALVNIVWNTGEIGSKSKGLSTPLEEALEAKNYVAAAEIIKKYRLTSAGVYNPGLIDRRQREANLFLS